MKKILYPIIIAVIVIIIVVVFFYFTRSEADETNSNNNLNVTVESAEETCQHDDDCIGTCTCGCIVRSATCLTDSGEGGWCLEHPLCKCEDGSCLEKSLEANANQNENTNTNQAVEETETTTTEFTKTGNLTGDAASGFTLLYEETGNPALTAILNFDYPGYTSSCTIDGVAMTCLGAIDQELIIVGDLVTVTGTKISDEEVAVTMLDK